jgi:hypothetical protein
MGLTLGCGDLPKQRPPGGGQVVWGRVALSWQGNSFSSARARERSAVTISVVNQALWCRDRSFPLRLQPELDKPADGFGAGREYRGVDSNRCCGRNRRLDR